MTTQYPPIRITDLSAEKHLSITRDGSYATALGKIYNGTPERYYMIMWHQMSDKELSKAAWEQLWTASLVKGIKARENMRVTLFSDDGIGSASTYPEDGWTFEKPTDE